MERLSIGDLARTTGLTVRALRHNQDLDLLAPAGVDPATRYRAYGPEQLERALTIARLRRLGLPLARIRDYLAATDPAFTDPAFTHPSLRRVPGGGA